jgi:hypothetical protein
VSLPEFDRDGIASGLDNGEAQAVERTALFGFVRFVAGGVAIAEAEEASRAGDVEGDERTWETSAT